jgi:hypothetical protein
MTRLLSIILNLAHLLKSQRSHAQGSINQQHNAEDRKAQLELIHTALKQIETEANADRALKNEELRLERQRLWIERVTLALVIAGAVGAFYNLKLLKASMEISEQQLRAMYVTLQTQQRAYVNVQDIKLVSFEVGKRPEASVSYKNSGLTPANYLVIALDSFLYEVPAVGPLTAQPAIDETYLSCGTNRGLGPILPPGVTRTVNTLRLGSAAFRGMRKSPPAPTNKFLDDMRHMKSMWYVVVYITYFDSFGDCHWSAEPFEFDPFTQTFTPSIMNAVPDWSDYRNTKNQPQP